MAPNVRKDLNFTQFEYTAESKSVLTKKDDECEIKKLLCKHGKNETTAPEDDTGANQSKAKRRTSILENGVYLRLMKKSDYEGFKRFFANIGIMVATGYAIASLDIFPFDKDNLKLDKLALFIPLYLFYGFQFQCFAFAGQHEFLHGNAWKTKWVNDVVLFSVGTVCFEFGKHERLMHKQHHTFTNNIDKDPELTSFYSREELEDPRFRIVAKNRFDYFRQFLFVWETLLCRLGRIVNSARGIPVDYSGRGWSMKTPTYSKESGTVQELQNTARLQLFVYLVVFGTFGRSLEGLQALFFWWIVPVSVGYPAVNYFRNLEHADCDVSKDTDCLHNTRTVESNFIVRQLLWNTNYHVEHHLYPMIPFFNLPELHELIKDYVIHGEYDNFTSQNWACVKPGGWIDQQQGFDSVQVEKKNE